MDAGRVSSMNQNNNNINEGLPFGYRFNPTPFEDLQYYLVPKLKGEPLPPGYVKELDVYQYDPHQIPLNEFKYAREHEAYFFVPVTRKLLLRGEGNLIRATPSGCWRSYEKNIPLYARDGSVIGYKNKLEFYTINGVKTDWKMVEYRTNFSVNGNLESCMICKLNLKVKDEEVPDEEDGAGDESEEVLSWSKMIAESRSYLER